jgi:hypothetical protein
MGAGRQIEQRLTTACTRRRSATLRGAGEADRWATADHPEVTHDQGS